MLIFQENTRLPVVQVSMKDLPLATLLDVLESHQFLQLPRLSSQEVFDHLCPPGNLLRGIDNWSGAARCMVQGPKQSLWQQVTLFLYFNLKQKIVFTNNIGHTYRYCFHSGNNLRKKWCIKKLQFWTMFFPYKKYCSEKRT